MLRVADVLADHHSDIIHANVIYGKAPQDQVIYVRLALRAECYSICLETKHLKVRRKCYLVGTAVLAVDILHVIVLVWKRLVNRRSDDGLNCHISWLCVKHESGGWAITSVVYNC